MTAVDVPTVASLSSAELLNMRERYVAPSFYQVSTVAVAHAEGAWLADPEGKRYLDFASGIGVNLLGHNHPEILDAVRSQLDRYSHLSFHVSLYDGYVRLAEALDGIYPRGAHAAGEAFPTKSVLVNSGAEAVENALKIARAATGREYVIAFQNGFHGRTYGSMAATGRAKPSRAPFMGSISPTVIHLPYPYPYRPLAPLGDEQLTDFYVGLIERALETQITPDLVAAIIAEPIQGEGGFVVPPADYFARLRQLCDRHGILLIADEVQTGFARTGKTFAMEHWGVAPDLLCTAKALGAGFPLGAVTGRAEIMDRLPEGSLGTTFGGHPVSCAAALKLIEIMRRDDLPGRAMQLGDQIRERFAALSQRFDCVGDVRGIGAMQAIELVENRATKRPATDLAAAVSKQACDRGLLTIKAGMYANVIRALIPLTISEDELHQGIDILEASLESVVGR